MIDPEDTGSLPCDTARRLRRSRLAIGLDQQTFGTEAGLSQPQYNQFENGKRLITLQAALALCERFNLTLDWIYRGDPSNLPYALANRINELRKSGD